MWVESNGSPYHTWINMNYVGVIETVFDGAKYVVRLITSGNNSYELADNFSTQADADARVLEIIQGLV